MLFSVVYEVTVHGDDRLANHLPRKSLRKYLQGGVEDENPYAYLDDGWAAGKCWKGAGILTRTQFEAFVDDCGLSAEDVQTMGTLGGPLGFGVVADINFRGDDPCAIHSCRVTPILNRTPKRMEEEGTWERVRSAILRQFERGVSSHFPRVPYEARVAYHDRITTHGPEYAARCQRELREARAFWDSLDEQEAA